MEALPPVETMDESTLSSEGEEQEKAKRIDNDPKLNAVLFMVGEVMKIEEGETNLDSTPSRATSLPS